MNVNKLKLSQVNCFLLTVVPVTKLIFLPSVLATYSQEGCAISALLCFIPDFLITLFVIIKNRRYNVTIQTLIVNSAVKYAEKVIFTVYVFYFFAKALLLIVEQKYFVENTLYETTANLFSFTPFFIISFYFAVKDLRTLGRCCNVAVVAIIIGLAVAFFLSVAEADYKNLLPFFARPTTDYFNSFIKTTYWFGDSTYMLFLMGNFDDDNKKANSVLLAYGAVIATVVGFIAVFYAIYGRIAQNQLYAVTQATKYSVVLSNVMRFDYIATMLTMFCNVFALCVPIYFCVDCLCKVFNLKNKFVPSAIVNGLMILITVAFEGTLIRTVRFSSVYLSWFFVFTAYVLSVLILLIKPKGVKYENNKK